MPAANLLAYSALEREALGRVEADPLRADETLAALVERWPDRLRPRRLYARLLMKRSEFGAALLHWQHIAELDPADIEPLMALARIHKKLQAPRNALPYLDTVLQRNPHHREAGELRSNIAREEIARVADQLAICDPDDLQRDVEELEAILGADERLEALKRFIRSKGTEAGEMQNAAGDFRGRVLPRLVARTPQSPERMLAQILEGMRLGFEDCGAGRSTEREAEAFRIVFDCPWLASKLSLFYCEQGNADSALDVYRNLDQRTADAETWIEAATLASDCAKPIAVVEFCQRALKSEPSTEMMARVSRLLVDNQQYDTAAALWRSSAGYKNNLRVRLSVIRILHKAGDDAKVLDEAYSVLSSFRPLENVADRDLDDLVEIVRRLRQCASRSKLQDDLARHVAILSQDGTTDVLTRWILGCLAIARLDAETALMQFEAARSLPTKHRLPIDLDAEIAVLHARYHHFGRANSAARLVKGEARTHRAYRISLEMVERVVGLCGVSEDLLYPECLIDIILAECEAPPLRYSEVPGRVLTFTASLGQGGSERQTVTVLQRMARDPRVERISLAVRSQEHEAQRFFLPAVRELQVELFVYGAAWRKKSELLQELPQLVGRDLLIAALELLPYNLREEIIRCCKLILDERPQAVHMRQDLFAAALACAMTGVPKYLIHRGSLSPDLWGYNELQANLHLRPMRHTYRRLLQRPEFLIVNNSIAGMQSDLEWTGCPDKTRIKLVYNAVEFEQLGPDISPNLELREKMGIAPHHPVVGGAFRLEPVKRPMLWIAAAAIVAETVSDAHFVILGDGALGADIRAFAEARGFADRVHMPGRVSDVGQWFRIMDVNMLTSEREGLPNVLIEGQHFGVPAVTSDVGGASETLEPGVTGHLIHPDADADSFAGAVISALRDETWRRRARKATQEFAHNKFGAAQTVDRLLECLGIIDDNQQGRSQ